MSAAQAALRLPFDRAGTERLCWLILAAAGAAYVALVMILTRGATLFIDETALFIGDRGLDLKTILTPLNGHLVAVERLLYALSFDLTGPDFVALRIAQAVAAVAAAALTFAYLSRRVGHALALPPSLLLLFLGSAWEANAIPAGLTNTTCVAFGVGALLMLDRDDRLGDRLACALLVLSVASWSLGVALAIGIGARLLAGGSELRRAWIFLIPLALYAVWFAWSRLADFPPTADAGSFALHNIAHAPAYASAVAGALTGLNYDFTPDGGPFAVFAANDSWYTTALAVIAAVALAWRLRRGRITPALAGAITALAAFWVALALGYGLGRTPETVRYTYPGAILVLVVAAEALAGYRPSYRVVLPVSLVCLLAVVPNLARLDDGMNFYRDISRTERARLTALELASERISPDFVSGRFPPVQAGPYLDAVERNGSPAYSEQELAAQPESRRAAADATLVGALAIAPAPAPAAQAQQCDRVANRQTAALTTGPAQLVVRAAGEAGGELALRRFAATVPTLAGELSPGQWAVVEIPPDASTRPWTVSLGDGGPLEVCSVPSPS